MSVQKSKGKWFPVIYNSETKKHVWFSGFDKKSDALKEERRIRSEFDNGRVWINDGDTFDKLFEEWQELEMPEKYKSKNAAETSKKLVKNHALVKFKGMTADRITPQMVARLIHSAQKLDGSGPLSNASKHKLLSTLTSIFDCGQRWGYVNSNPCEGITLQSPKKIKYTLWTTEQLSAFLGFVADTKYYTPIFILATTGMRRGEVCGLQWKDYRNECLVLERAMDVYGEVTDMKTEASHRVIALMSSTIDVLEEQKAAQTNYKKIIGQTQTVLPWDYICTNEFMEPIKPNALSKFFHKAILRYNAEHENAELPIIRLHDLRHTLASTALANDINIKIVSEMLGHSRTSTTQNIYQHVITENLQKEAVIKLEDKLFGADVRPDVRLVK